MSGESEKLVERVEKEWLWLPEREGAKLSRFEIADVRALIDTIATLTAERTRMREALDKIVDQCESEDQDMRVIARIWRIALQAKALSGDLERG